MGGSVGEGRSPAALESVFFSYLMISMTCLFFITRLESVLVTFIRRERILQEPMAGLADDRRRAQPPRGRSNRAS